MSDFKRPGTYMSETLAPPVADVGVSLSNGVIVGPMSRGPVALTAVDSFKKFTSLYGGFQPGGATSDMVWAAYQFFNNGGRNLNVVRVVTGSEVEATANLLDQEATGTAPVRPRPTLAVNAANPGTWGNSLSVSIVHSPLDATRFTLAVYNNGTQVETFRDLTMDNTDVRYAPNIINSSRVGSIYITVTDQNVMRDPTVPATLSDATPAQTGTVNAGVLTLVPVQLSGGVNAAAAPTNTEWANALALVDGVADPFTLNLPGVTSATLVNQAISYVDPALGGRGDCFLVVDGVTTAAGVAPVAADAITAAQSYNASSYAAVYFPRPRIADPSSSVLGATVVVPAGGAVLGQYAANDAATGVQKTPAGLQTRIANAVGLEVALSNADLDSLNMSNVNAIRSLPGAGIVIFGGRTLTTTGRADKYVSVRRTLIYLKAQLQQLANFAVFEDNYTLTWQQVSNVLEQFLLGFWSQGGLKGSTASEAFLVTVDDTNNTDTTIDNGEMHIDVQVALLKPAEFVAINISQVDSVISVAEAA